MTDPSTLEAVAGTVARASAGAAVLIAGTWILRIVLRRWLSAGVLALLGTLVLVRLGVPSIPESRFSVFQWIRITERPAAENRERLAKPSEMRKRETFDAEAAPAYSSLQMRAAKRPPAKNPLPEASQPTESVGWLALGWLGGFLLFGSIVVVRYARARSWLRRQPAADDPELRQLFESCLARTGIRRPVGLRQSSETRSPAVVGCFPPVVIIPDAALRHLGSAELTHVLLHELTHVRRHDILKNALGTFACCLHWFNPMAWLAMRQWRADREVLCDEAVVRMIGESDRRAYGRTLLRFINRFQPARPAPCQTAIFTSKNEIKRRLTMITKTTGHRKLGSVIGTLSLAAIAAFAFTAAAPAEEESEREEEREREHRREHREKREHREREHAEEREHRERREVSERRRHREVETEDLERRERAERREHEERDRESHEAEVERVRAEIRELREHEKFEEARHLERELAEHLEHRERERDGHEAREREHREDRERERESDERTRYLLRTAERLEDEGFHEEAELLRHGIRERQGEREREREHFKALRDSEREELAGHVAELSETVTDLREAMQEMREAIARLQERAEKDEAE